VGYQTAARSPLENVRMLYPRLSSPPHCVAGRSSTAPVACIRACLRCRRRGKRSCANVATTTASRPTIVNLLKDHPQFARSFRPLSGIKGRQQGQCCLPGATREKLLPRRCAEGVACLTVCDVLALHRLRAGRQRVTIESPIPAGRRSQVRR